MSLGICLTHNNVCIDGKWFYLKKDKAMDVYDKIQEMGLTVEWITGKDGSCPKCIAVRNLQQQLQRR